MYGDSANDHLYYYFFTGSSSYISSPPRYILDSDCPTQFVCRC